MKTHGQILLSTQEKTGRNVWELKANADVMIRVKRLFPRAAKQRTGAITLVDTPEVARDLEWLLGRWPMDVPDDTFRFMRERADEHRLTETAVHEILTGQRPHLEFREPAREPRDYQLVAADLAVTTGQLLLTDEVGLGKSMSGLLVLRHPEALPALIVCLTHLPAQWMSELEKTLPWLTGHSVRTLSAYDPAEGNGGVDPDVLIMGYSKLRGWDDHLAGKVRTVIFDEVQELRRATSGKYMAAAHVAHHARFRLGLTASPVYNYGGEMHNIMQVLAPDRLGDREEFGREWCGGSWGDKVSVRDPAALGVYLREQGLMLRRTRKEVGRELPDVIRVVHGVESDEDVLDELSEGTVDLAEMIVNRSGSREEIFRASGDLDWRVRHATGVAKAPYVADFVRMLMDTEEQVVLFGWHRAVYGIWERRLAGFDPVFYTGSESPTQKLRNADTFLRGDSQLLVMSLRAGVGLDGLQEVSHVAVFGELDWSPVVHDQCVGRLRRDGQEEPVVAYFLLSEQGSDPVVAEVLNLKRMQSAPMIDPDAPLFLASAPEDRVRMLAEEVMKRRRVLKGAA